MKLFFFLIFILNCKKETLLENLIFKKTVFENIQFQFQNGSYIKKEKNNKRILLFFHDSKKFYLRNNLDIKHLLEKSNENNLFCKLDFCLDKNESLESFLEFNLKNYYSNFKSLGGNKNAKNLFSYGQFYYQLINQVQSENYAIKAVEIWKKTKNKKELPEKAKKYWDENSVRGLECHAASLIHQLKSLGLIRPDLNREEVEERYTELHFLKEKDEAKIPKKLNHVLRFRKFSFSEKDILEITKILQNTDWAILTGMNQKKIQLIALKHLNQNNYFSELQKILDEGFVISVKQVSFSHNVILKELNNGKAVLDDSYAMQFKEDQKFKLENYFKFWYLRIE